MSKVQTFEEWLDSKSEDWRENMPTAIFYILRDAWIDAHENAARVCEDMCPYTEYPARQCADAIREAAK